MTKKPNPPALYFQLFTEISIIDQLSSSRLERVIPHSLTKAQFGLLNHCVRLGDGWTQVRLAKAFQVTKATMTSTLKRLSAKGFVTIRQDAKDARAKRVFLTKAGHNAWQEAVEAAAQAMVDVPDGLSPKEVESLLPALTKLRIWLDENR